MVISNLERRQRLTADERDAFEGGNVGPRLRRATKRDGNRRTRARNRRELRDSRTW